MLTTILALVVSAAIDSTTLFIGDQTDLHLRATCEVGEQVTLPLLDEQLIPGIAFVLALTLVTLISRLEVLSYFLTVPVRL